MVSIWLQVQHKKIGKNTGSPWFLITQLSPCRNKDFVYVWVFCCCFICCGLFFFFSFFLLNTEWDRFEGDMKELRSFLCFTLVSCHNWFRNCKYYSSEKQLLVNFEKKASHLWAKPFASFQNKMWFIKLWQCSVLVETVPGILELKVSSVNITLTSEQRGQKFKSLGLSLYPSLTA